MQSNLRYILMTVSSSLLLSYHDSTLLSTTGGKTFKKTFLCSDSRVSRVTCNSYSSSRVKPAGCLVNGGGSIPAISQLLSL